MYIMYDEFSIPYSLSHLLPIPAKLHPYPHQSLSKFYDLGFMFVTHLA